MQTRHSCILVAESIRRPNAALAFRAVDCIREAIRSRFFSAGTVVGRIGQQTWRHAGPNCEDCEGDQIAHGHCASSSLIYRRAIGESIGVGCDGDVVEPDEEENGAGDVNEGVGAIDPVHQCRVLYEVLLNRRFPEDVQPLFEVN